MKFVVKGNDIVSCTRKRVRERKRKFELYKCLITLEIMERKEKKKWRRKHSFVEDAHLLFSPFSVCIWFIN